MLGQKITKAFSLISGVVILNISFSLPAFAQGQDGTPAERDIMILGEMLPGFYNNANQAYFDGRLKRPESERHDSIETVIKRIQAPKMGDYVFSVEQKAGETNDNWLYVLSVDNKQRGVRMKTYATDVVPVDTEEKIKGKYQKGCDLLWRQEAGQFHGELAAPNCKIGAKKKSSAYDMFLSQDALWLRNGNSGEEHYAMQRARMFDCYIDVPGVGGGRDIPYERIQVKGMHDLGAERWVKTKEGLEIGISLFRVLWPMNTYENFFTRPSFVVYAKEKLEDGSTKESGYSWTTPKAERIGINLKWMLVNCSMLSSADIPAFYKDNEPLVNP